MEANVQDFRTASHPCSVGSCDVESQCKRSVDANAYGPGAAYTIDTTRDYSVQTRFWAETDAAVTYYTYLNRIETTLTQDGNSVVITQDCTDYLATLTEKLYQQMGMAISTWGCGTLSNCGESCGTANTVISNLNWQQDDSIVPYDNGAIIDAGATPKLNSAGCGENCSECRSFYYENAPTDTWNECVDTREMRFVKYCPSSWNSDKCQTDEPYCMRAYPFGDPDKTRSAEYECRSLPPERIGNLSDQVTWRNSNRECRTSNGLCYYGCNGGTCHNSWFRSDPLKGKSASAMCRCKN